MSQEQSQSQPTSDNDELQEDNLFHIELHDDNAESISALHSLLHPNTIDWYVLRQFLFIVFEVTLGISVVYIIMDYLGSADVFMQKCQQHNASLPIALFKYYMPRILTLLDKLLTVCIIIPGVVLINQMINHQEMLVLSCMGVSRVRASFMIFVASLLLILLFLAFREFLFPAQRAIISCDINSFFEQNTVRVESKSDPMTTVYVSGESLDLKNKIIIKPILSMPVMFLNDYGQTITADEAIWKPAKLGSDAESSRQAGFLLKNVAVNKGNLDDQSSLILNEKTILYTPLNNPWLKKGEAFLVSGLEIEDLTINSSMIEYSSIPELQRIMERMPVYQRREAAIVLHNRLARPFMDMLVVFVGLSFILSKDTRVLVIILKTVLWWGGSWIFINMTNSLAGDADQLLSPAMAAWASLIFLAASAAYVWDNVFY